MSRLALLLVALLLGCPAPTPTCPSLSELGLEQGDMLEEPDPDAPDFPAFAAGVEYIQLGTEHVYAEAGAGWAKTRLEAFAWDTIQPSAPKGGERSYDWNCPDGQISAWQQAGVTNIQSYLQPESSWGSRGVNDLRPKVAREDEYRDWVAAVFERYDGDGIEDMPGLVRPVNHWVIGGEWTGFWKPDDPQSYLEVLEMTREEALEANPDALLGAIPFLLIDVFEGNEPTDAQIEARLLANDGPRNSGEGVLAILDRDDLFDYACVHSLGDYTELPPTARWLRAEMAERGYDKPIWVDDAFAISFLANNFWPVWYPATEATEAALFDVLDQVARRSSDEAAAWVEAEVAKGVVHKGATALGEGFVGIQLGNTEDWMPVTDLNLRRTAVSFTGAAATMGWVDVDPGEGGLGDLRVPGSARPALRNYSLLVEKLGDGAFDVIEPLGGLTGIRGYRFEREGTPLWILWAEDGVLQLPDEEEPPTTLTLTPPAGIERLCVTEAVTITSAPEPETVCVDLPGGQLVRELTSVPVFIEPEPVVR